MRKGVGVYFRMVLITLVPYDLEKPITLDNVGEECMSRGSAIPPLQQDRAQSLQFWEFLSIYAYTI